MKEAIRKFFAAVKKHKKPVIISLCAVVLVVAVVIGCIYMPGWKQNYEYRKAFTTLDWDMTITAHSGCMDTEANTMESLELGSKNGDIVEFDVLFDEAGVPYLGHDEVAENAVPFSEALQYLVENDVVANVDLKEADSNLANLCDIVKEYDAFNNVFFTGVGEEYMEAVQKYCPGIKYYLNLTPEEEKLHDEDYINSIVDMIRKYDAIGLNTSFTAMSSELAEAVLNAGYELSLYTAVSKSDMYHALYYHPTNITTLYPDELAELIKSE